MSTQVKTGCRRCGRPKQIKARGLDSLCYRISSEDGTLTDYPSQLRAREDVVADYLVLVAQNEHLTNAEIAKRLGMTRPALIQVLARARAAGQLSLHRINDAGRVLIARHGERNGVPAR